MSEHEVELTNEERGRLAAKSPRYAASADWLTSIAGDLREALRGDQ